MPDDLGDIGALAAALAKAQAAFPTIPRDKTVTVQTKTGGSYTFSYAPLDTILGLVRGPLAENDLAVTQLLDGDDLVTMLLHAKGASLTGRMPIPHAEGTTIQSLGSAITYLRRYAIQAILGIAAEEDDDGNSAAGNAAKTKSRTEAKGEHEELVGIEVSEGTIQIGGAATTKLEVRETPNGPAFGFYLKTPKATDDNLPQVIVKGALAAAVIVAEGDPAKLKGQWCRVKGRIVSVREAGRRGFFRMYADEFETRDYKLPADPEPAAAEVQPSGQAQAGSPSGAPTLRGGLPAETAGALDPTEEAELDALVLPLGQS